MELPAATDAVVCGPVWISPEEMCEMRLRGRPVKISPKSMRALAYLIRAEGRVVGRDELMQHTSGTTRGASSRAMDVRVLRIRRALGTCGQFLIAVPGRGYRIDVLGLSRAK